MNAILDTQTLVVEGETVALPLAVDAPLRKCYLDAGISTARGGPFLHGTLMRTLVVADGVVPPLKLYSRDLRALFPRGGRVWLVVRYCGQLVALGELQLLIA
ncbi:MAG: hypothetical protein K2R93_12495 [Gemmatimonadaceae bacterium]|nr:hypothetical protein [Gemmatimonadaceae bacterium]